MQILPLEKDEGATVWEFLCLAAHEDYLKTVQTNPHLARYAQNWGREGDFGFAAHHDNGIVGLVWARLFPVDEPGFGWVSERIPEISLAVRPEFRGQGVGRLLVEAIISEAQIFYGGLSLNVRSDNYAAIRIYEGCGFLLVPESEIPNRIGGISFTMRLQF